MSTEHSTTGDGRPRADGTAVESHGPTEHGPDCPCPRCTGFLRGHDLATRHGAYAFIGIQGRSAEVADVLTEVMEAEGFYRPAFAPTIQACATVLVRLERAALALDRLDEALAQNSPLTAYLNLPGERADAMDRLRKDMRAWASTARAYLNDLGLTPAAYARIARDAGQAGRAKAALDALHEHVDAHYAEVGA